MLIAMMGTAAKAQATPLETTLAALEQHHPASLSDVDTETKNQIVCLALNLYHEARGSTLADIMAVGFSTRNRTNPAKEKGYCDVIWQKGQYEWTRRPLAGIMPRERAAWERMVENARRIIVEDLPDTTNGATSFYSRKITPPVWTRKATSRKVIGGHVYVRIPGYASK